MTDMPFNLSSIWTVVLAVSMIQCDLEGTELRLRGIDGSSTRRIVTGTETPEGAACDLLRAFLSQDAELFHRTRCKQACEGWADPGIAYNAFLSHEPIPVSNLESAGDVGRGAYIEHVSIAKTKKLTEEEAFSKLIGLQLNSGAIDSVVVEVVLVDVEGKRYLFRVEAVQLGGWDDEKQRLVPTNQWRASL